MKPHSEPSTVEMFQVCVRVGGSLVDKPRGHIGQWALFPESGGAGCRLGHRGHRHGGQGTRPEREPMCRHASSPR